MTTRNDRSVTSFGRRLATGIAVVAGAAAALLAASSTASADVTLTASNPAQGATVKTPLKTISLTFSEPVNGEQITVSLAGPGGSPISLARQPSSVDATVSQPVPALANGAYSLAFDVVAADGHPLSGKVAFTVALPAAATTTAPPATSAPVTQTESNAAAADPDPAAQEIDDSGSPLWWIIGGAVIVLAAVVLGVVLARQRRNS